MEKEHRYQAYCGKVLFFFPFSCQIVIMFSVGSYILGST